MPCPGSSLCLSDSPSADRSGHRGSVLILRCLLCGLLSPHLTLFGFCVSHPHVLCAPPPAPSPLSSSTAPFPPFPPLSPLLSLHLVLSPRLYTLCASIVPPLFSCVFPASPLYFLLCCLINPPLPLHLLLSRLFPQNCSSWWTWHLPRFPVLGCITPLDRTAEAIQKAGSLPGTLCVQVF